MDDTKAINRYIGIEEIQEDLGGISKATAKGLIRDLNELMPRLLADQIPAGLTDRKWYMQLIHKLTQAPQSNMNITECKNLSFIEQLLAPLKDPLTANELVEILPYGRNSTFKLLKNGTIRSSMRFGKYQIPKAFVIDFMAKEFPDLFNDVESQDRIKLLHSDKL